MKVLREVYKSKDNKFTVYEVTLLKDYPYINRIIKLAKPEWLNVESLVELYLTYHYFKEDVDSAINFAKQTYEKLYGDELTLDEIITDLLFWTGHKFVEYGVVTFFDVKVEGWCDGVEKMFDKFIKMPFKWEDRKLYGYYVLGIKRFGSNIRVVLKGFRSNVEEKYHIIVEGSALPWDFETVEGLVKVKSYEVIVNVRKDGDKVIVKLPEELRDRVEVKLEVK